MPKTATKLKKSNMCFVSTLILLFSIINTHHYEKFFEIEGGPQYMYYFAKFSIGDPESEQSAIIDTGSDTLAFPCDHCASSDCGTHQDPRFTSAKSKSFNFEMRCPVKIFYHKHQVCQFIKSYAEGSSLLGFLATDYIKFKNAKKVSDEKLSKLNSQLKKDLKVKAEFGCTTKETGLFKTQYADGIIGLDNNSGFIESVEQDWGAKQPKIFSFGLCFHNSGGIMSVDMRNKNAPDDKIVMLNKKVSDYVKAPVIVPYSAFNSYYEVKVESFEIGGLKVPVEPINMMIDSGTTFTHFPDAYIKNILKTLNNYCSKNPKMCGKIAGGLFTEDSCLQFKKPDADYSDEDALLNSFPEIKLFLGKSERPYVLYPHNYFYKEFDESKSEVRLCIALKGEEQGRIILGAFSMIDHYFYFDRKEKRLMIFEEDCKVKSAQILRKKRILEEMGIKMEPQRVNEKVVWGMSLILPMCWFIVLLMRKLRVKGEV